MAPSLSQKKSQAELKQKTLAGWFGAKPSKDGAASSSQPTLKAPALKTPAKSTSSIKSAKSSDEKAGEPRTPATPSSPMVNLGHSSPSAASEPPQSDAPDVEMMSDASGVTDVDEEDDKSQRKARAAKRKVLVLDSDSGEETQAKSARTKKQRMAIPLSDEEEDDGGASAKLSQRISRFKKSPQKKSKSRSRSRASDDDDFVVSDSELSPVTSRRSASRASSPDASDDEDDGFIVSDEDEDAPKKKSKTKGKSGGGTSLKRPTLTKGPAVGSGGGGGGSSNNFLTAAERRAMENKDTKKSQEDPFEFLLDVRDKDGVRPGEPKYDPRTLYIPPKAWKEFTPFEKQFWEIKQNHFDTVLFFQKGKFLELYEDDARIGHREFDLKLTQRVKMSMVGVPEMAFNFWAAKFLAKGYKVGRVDQAETALGAEMRLAADKGKGKGAAKEKDKIVRRELNKVYTNGTLVDPELLTDEQAGHCIALREAPPSNDDRKASACFGLCVLDTSTSEFNLAAFADDVCRTKLETMIRQLRVKEIIYPKDSLSVDTTRLLKAVLPSNCIWSSLRASEGFNYDRTIKELRTLYPGNGTYGDEGDADAMVEDGIVGGAVPKAVREMLHDRNAVEALGNMIWYLRTLNIDKDILSMKNFNVYDPMKQGEGLILDGQTLAHIEVLLNSDGTEDGSLLKLLGRCVTPFGKRLFRIWLCMPLRKVSDINARLDAVQDLLDRPSFETDFTDVAKGLPDLERIVSRIHAKNCKVKDFLKVLQSFRKLNKGLTALAESADGFESRMISGLLRGAPDLEQHIKHVESMFNKPDKDSDELTPVDGKDEEYDGIMTELNELEETLEKELKKLEKKVGTDLTYWHSAQGNKEIYLVQTKASFKDVPKDWTKSGSTKAFSRWLVPSLSTTIRRVKEGRENRNQAIKNFKLRVFAEFDADRSVWLRAIRILAELDCLFSLAKSSAALDEPICRPELVEGDAAFIDFEELRHPALSSLKGDFIPNDVKLGDGVGRIALLTGPNMGGKSTAMRMTAAGVIMAQLGMMVPAKRARLCPVDAILTRMGAYDNMFSNASTFKVELDESCKILREATPKSLVILDELGRGTSTYDGMAIAGAVLHELATHTLALAFFATHYGSLTDDFAYSPAIRNMHMSTMVDEEKRELVFLYKLVDGIATSSFGTHVAKLAGVPNEVVERADAISRDFAQQFKAKIEDRKKSKTANAALPLVAQADFAYLLSLALGKSPMPENPVRRREVLLGLKAAMRNCLRS